MDNTDNTGGGTPLGKPIGGEFEQAQPWSGMREASREQLPAQCFDYLWERTRVRMLDQLWDHVYEGLREGEDSHMMQQLEEEAEP